MRRTTALRHTVGLVVFILLPIVGSVLVTTASVGNEQWRIQQTVLAQREQDSIKHEQDSIKHKRQQVKIVSFQTDFPLHI